jgi:signal transduction histidine kinase
MADIDDAIKERLRLMLSRNLSAQEEERRRVARDLHDHLGQQLTALHLQLDAVHRLSDQQGGSLSEPIARVQMLAQQIDRDLHFLTSEMRTSVLDHLGLAAALTDYVEFYEQTHALPVSLDVIGFGERRLTSELEIHLFRIAQEALNNVRKHAHATNVEVVLQHHDGRVVLTVADNGIGFDVDAMTSNSHDAGLGILGMRERAALAGGSLQIECLPEQGCSVILSAPAVFRDSSAA